jgi:predicted O-linked N-acetylglucosamine transferase (SPINDLY family)
MITTDTSTDVRHMLNSPINFDTSADLFAEALKLISAGELGVAPLLECAEKLKALGQPQRAAEVYKAWIAYNSDNPILHAIYFNYGMSLSDIGDKIGAINALRESIRLKPDFYRSYINLGRLFEDQGQAGRAVSQWLTLTDNLAVVNADSVVHKITALKQMGRVLESNSRDSAAEDALKQSLDIAGDQPEVIQHWIALRQRQCKWPVLVPSEFITKAKLTVGISPLSLANYADDPLFQLANAYQYNKKSIGIPKATRPFRHQVPATPRTEKLRIGYVSSDLRQHAVGFSMTDVIETHDRNHFEIFAYYCGVPWTDNTQERIKKSTDHWNDINGISDEQAAQRIHEDRIDILIDLNGYTKDARTKVFSLRPAPINVNWFGFPGTMGSPYHHYIIADEFIIPHETEMFYSEKVLRLPCYQPNDRKRVISANPINRADEGLPENAIVYCCLNGMQKLTPQTFSRWMTILKSVENSVLWLLSGTAETNERLRDAARAQGVAGERLIFAQKKPNPEHVARYQLADLFLDNMPYGAHTTAADSIWMGVPILTLIGRSFASRVCGSLLKAADLADMICTKPEDYVARAIELGRDHNKLAAIRQRLVKGRDSCLLFDTPLLVRHLEDLFRQMWKDFENGSLPQPNLSNLDIYHEIGIELELDQMELQNEEAYRRLYVERLAARHDFYPVAADKRFWPAIA